MQILLSLSFVWRIEKKNCNRKIPIYSLPFNKNHFSTYETHIENEFIFLNMYNATPTIIIIFFFL